MSFLLTGGVTFENPYKNPASAWLTDKAWGEVVRASNLKGSVSFSLLSYHLYFIKIITNNLKVLRTRVKPVDLSELGGTTAMNMRGF